MYYFEYPKIDATIYEGSVTSSINTGLDQILEINKNMNSAGTTIDVSRVLIQFDKVIGDMILRLGGKINQVKETFNPEGGAYGMGRTHGHKHWQKFWKWLL